MLKHLENSIDLEPKLQKAPVNYEGVSFESMQLYLLDWTSSLQQLSMTVYYRIHMLRRQVNALILN